MEQSVTRLQDACARWTYELLAATRTTLEIYWERPDQALQVPVTALAEIALSRPTRWSAIANLAGLNVDAILGLIERSEEIYRERGHLALSLVVGSVTLDEGGPPLPLYLARLGATRVARRVNDWEIELLEPLTPCALTEQALIQDHGIDVGAQVFGDVQSALDDVRRLQEDTANRSVKIEVAGGFLSQSSGFLDVELDLSTFTNLADSTIVMALAGDEAARARVRSETPILTAEEFAVPLPADSTQLDVIRRVRDGVTLVIEGPPGTGKSQTIANVLARSALDGKRILFVAEKRAAVDVVLRRLNDIGMTPFVLDIHRDARGVDVSRFDQALMPSGSNVPPVLATPPPSMFRRSESHHAAIEGLLPSIPALVARRSGKMPDVSTARIENLLERLGDIEPVLGRFRAVEASLAAAGVVIAVGDLLLLRSNWPALAQLANALSAGEATGPIEELVRRAKPMRRIADLGDQLRADAPLPTGGSRIPHDLYVGSYTGTSVRRSVVTAFTAALEELSQVGDGPTALTIGELVTQARAKVWTLVPGGSPELRACLRSIRVGQVTMEAALSEESSGLMLAAAEASRILADVHQSVIDDIDGSGLLGHLIAAERPRPFLLALVAWSRVDVSELAVAEELDAEARAACDSIDATRTELFRSMESTVRARAGRRANEDAAWSDEAVTLEGLLRRGRRRKLTPSELLGSAPNAVLGVTPIVIASPWSAARCLPQQVDMFDLLVVDEASQVETSSVVAALARARQVVVFGDSLQLPPNRFFRSPASASDDPVLSQESLLDAVATMLTQTDRTLWLRWHYRSVDDRLVEFVNSAPELYNGRLLVPTGLPDLPSPIRVVHYKGHPAEAVRAALAERAAGESAAVITFGVDLAEEIESLIGLVCEAGNEPTVVRNVERFQGDERDFIVLVLPWVKDGRSILQSLGPIGQTGGERRLNVALTRARSRMVVLTNFTPDDLVGAESVGGRLLGDFLRSAESGGVDVGPALSMDTDPTVKYVVDRLNANGIEARVLPARSNASARIHAHVDGRDLCVDVETTALVRLDPIDREVVRQSELKRRGWRFVRTTIREWLIDEPAMLNRVRKAAEVAQ